MTIQPNNDIDARSQTIPGRLVGVYKHTIPALSVSDTAVPYIHNTSPAFDTPSFNMRSCLSSSTTLLATLGLAGLSSARKCQNMTVEVPVDARNAVFNLTAPASNIEVTDFILNLAQQGHNFSSTVLTGVSGPTMSNVCPPYVRAILSSAIVCEYQKDLSSRGYVL